MKLNEIRLDKHIEKERMFHFDKFIEDEKDEFYEWIFSGEPDYIGTIEEHSIDLYNHIDYLNDTVINNIYFIYNDKNRKNEPPKFVGKMVMLDYEKTGRIYEVDTISILPKYQGKNIGYKIYEHLILKQNFVIKSGTIQSLGSVKLYTKLANHPNIQALGAIKDSDKNIKYVQLDIDEVNDLLTSDIADIYHDPHEDELGAYWSEIQAIKQDIIDSTDEQEAEYLRSKLKKMQDEFDAYNNATNYYDQTIILMKK